MIRRGGPYGDVTLIPHSDYRGAYHAGSMPSGGAYSCMPAQPCLYVVWPKEHWGSYWSGGDPASGDWAGSLIRGNQDVSGLMYRRNRYYDPATGQFTQSDPIGIAGGLNTYGFAAGDPISFSDPFGLKADSVVFLDQTVESYVNELRAADVAFDKAMRILEKDSEFMYVFEIGSLYQSPGMVWDPVAAENRLDPGDVDTNLPIVSIMFDLSRIPVVNDFLTSEGLSGGPVTPQMVVGHEVYVHAVAFSRSRGANGCDHRPPTPTSCGIRRHNELGSRLGWPERKGW